MAMAYAHMGCMMLRVGKKMVRLPPGYCDADTIRDTVTRINPPFAVHPQTGGNFSVRKRVFLSVNGLSVECENDDELHFACKIVSLDHNRWQTGDDENLQQVLAETERMEADARERMEAPLDATDFQPGEIVREDEDITIEEWDQLGYKWFKKEDVVYL
jgi:hypothetical protein